MSSSTNRGASVATSGEPKPQVHGHRPGGRAAAVVAAVQKAAVELLDEKGYFELQLPEVARRAGVNKTTVYRRWPTRAALVNDLLLGMAAEHLPAKDTGGVVGDLVAHMEGLVEILRVGATRAVLTAMISGELDRHNDTIRKAFFAERFRLSAAIVDRAVVRGELPPETDVRLLLEDVGSPVYFRVLITGDAIDREDIELFVTRAVDRARIG